MLLFFPTPFAALGTFSEAPYKIISIFNPSVFKKKVKTGPDAA
jgi:hypothetical protein